MRLDRNTDSNTEWVTNTTVMRELAPQRQQIVVELEAGDLVERRERLVHQQHARRGDQRARDRHPHPHAAGEFARIGVGEIRQGRRAPAPPQCAAPRRRARRRRASAAGTRCRTPWPTASGSAPGTRSPDRGALRRSRHATVPRDGSLRPAMMRSAVDLPQPDGPSSDRNSPSRTSRSSPSSARTPLPNSFSTPRSDTIGADSAMVVVSGLTATLY